MNTLEETLRAVKIQKSVYNSKARTAKTEEEYDYLMEKVKILEEEENELLDQLKIEREEEGMKNG